MLSNLRLVKILYAKIDVDSKFHKSQWNVKFMLGNAHMSVWVENNGESRPLGRDIVNAMADYVRRGMVTEEELLDIKIIE